MKDLIYSNRIYELRKSYGISQDQMADDLDINRRTISKIENGEQNPSLDMVYRIAACSNHLSAQLDLNYQFVQVHLHNIG